MLTIVVPMAGRGSRFADAGYTQPKPLIPVKGSPMIQVVTENLRPSVKCRFVFVCQRQHIVDYHLDDLLPSFAPGCTIVPIDGVTEGAACTVLAARDFIDEDDLLMIANADQYVVSNADDWVAPMLQDKTVDGVILTMPADDPKWSYVERDSAGRVVRVVEKEVVSSEATVGIYLFRRGKDFIRAAEAMIEANDRVLGEFYVAPVYSRLAADGANISTVNVGAGMYGLGTPTDLDAFLATAIEPGARLGGER